MTLLEQLEVFWLAVTGLCIGSFLNVVIARVPAGESIVRPRSRCPRCGHSLPWYENIPLFSWLALRGRCSQCKAPISIQYPSVELATSILYLAAYLRFGWAYPLVGAVVLITLLIPLIVIDAQQWILPFELTLPGIGLGVLVWSPLGWQSVVRALASAAAGFLVFRLFELFGWLAFRKEAMGAGDKFLVAMVSAFLSWRSLLVIVFLSSLQGAIFGLARIALTGRAAAAEPVDPAAPEPEEAPPTMTWAFLEPGHSIPRRLLLLPWSLFLQPIPDEPKDLSGEEVEWKPGATNLPFGPWIGAAALEYLLFGPWLVRTVHLSGLL